MLLLFWWRRRLAGEGPVEPPVEVPLTRTAIRRVRRTPFLTDEKHWTFHERFRLDLETGVGLSTGQGDDPQVMLRYSDDGGHTWSQEKWAPMGKIGMYKARAVWNRLGRSRQRIYEIVISEPVKVVILGAELDITRGSH